MFNIKQFTMHLCQCQNGKINSILFSSLIMMLIYDIGFDFYKGC